MNLTELFYGKFVPPKMGSSRLHKLGFSGEPRFIPLQYKKERSEMTFEERLSKAGKKVLSILRMQVNPITSVEMSTKVPYTKNFCGQIMGEFVKEGLAKRYRVKKPNTYIYYYMPIKK